VDFKGTADSNPEHFLEGKADQSEESIKKMALEQERTSLQ
jgi:hypothetical protein